MALDAKEGGLTKALPHLKAEVAWRAARRATAAV